MQVRQVSFGMIKFLVFDYAKEIFFEMLPPGSSEDVRLSLVISLLSGAVAGVAASVVSQPADVLLSKVSGISRAGARVIWCLCRRACASCGYDALRPYAITVALFKCHVLPPLHLR